MYLPNFSIVVANVLRQSNGINARVRCDAYLLGWRWMHGKQRSFAWCFCKQTDSQNL